ncbi:MAG: nuclear transport factor 2 family protein [Bryobacterales bacterium]|jgi:uncharacterized protein (TIGR02246 family)|nr:nuclear transport factor 2 family protein [Bryobacterales bacterium]
MKHHHLTTTLILLALLLAQCSVAAAAAANADDVAAIRTLLGQHSAALTAGDPAGLTALFADNGVMMPPQRGAMTGKESIRWGLKIAFGLFAAKINSENVQVEAAGDLAYARRTSTMTLTAKTGGEQMELVANWLDILKRQPDGSWKIYLEIVNSDRPLPAVSE